MDLKRDAFPPTPVSPPSLAGSDVVFRYRSASNVIRAFRSDFRRYIRREELSAPRKAGDLEYLREEVVKVVAVDASDRTREQSRRLHEARETLAEYEGLTPIEPDSDDTVEERARLLSMVLHSVVIGGKEHLWPTDHAEQVRFLSEVAPHRSISELLWCIAREEYNEADAGKS